MVKGPGEHQFKEWATLADDGYEGQARDRAAKWVKRLTKGTEYRIEPA